MTRTRVAPIDIRTGGEASYPVALGCCGHQHEVRVTWTPEQQRGVTDRTTIPATCPYCGGAVPKRWEVGDDAARQDWTMRGYAATAHVRVGRGRFTGD